ncbi:hypothetical protein [Roseovarius ramblicola]|uniref:Uncharacterized protein n=1 Tax=Roseovarius ramblicola TaxID=2022336 RepID=A0ABV5I2U3_9RHOB
MTHHMDAGPARTEHVAAGLDGGEGRSPEDAATTEIAVHNAVRRIEKLMREDRRRRARDGLPDLTLPDDLAAAAAARGAKRRHPRTVTHARGALARLLAWRPGPAHGAWAAVFAAVLVWPATVLALLFTGFVICLAGVALFGPEILERLRERAERLVARSGERGGAAADADEEMPEARAARSERLHDLRG